MFVCVCVCAGEMTLVNLLNDDAKCLDGSLAGYYFRKGQAQDGDHHTG